jgi:hypothetical protein
MMTRMISENPSVTTYRHDNGCSHGIVQCRAEQAGNRAAVVHRDERRAIAAHRHEAGMPDGELTGEPVDQVQADSKGDVDANQVQDARVVGIDLEIAQPILEQVVQAEQQADRGGRRKDLGGQPHAKDGRA